MFAAAGVLAQKTERKARGPDRIRNGHWWESGYNNWDDIEFKTHLRLTRHTFNLVLQNITPFIIKQPTNLKPNPTPPETQLGVALYRLAHGCSYQTVGALFGVSTSLASKIFNKVMRVLVATMYDDYVHMPNSSEEWEAQLRGVIENYEFPCVGAMDFMSTLVPKLSKLHFDIIELKNEKKIFTVFTLQTAQIEHLFFFIVSNHFDN